MPQDGKALLVTVELDRPRRLLLDFNALASFEEATGKSVLVAGVLQEALQSVKGLRALLWACLVHEDADLTLQDVGAMLNFGNTEEITRRLQEAVVAALPDQEPEGNAEAAAPTRRGGRTSGR